VELAARAALALRRTTSASRRADFEAHETRVCIGTRDARRSVARAPVFRGAALQVRAGMAKRSPIPGAANTVESRSVTA
jgi:hypothetical protein